MIRKVTDLRTGLDYESVHKIHFPHKRSVLTQWLAWMIYVQG